ATADSASPAEALPAPAASATRQKIPLSGAPNLPSENPAPSGLAQPQPQSNTHRECGTHAPPGDIDPPLPHTPRSDDPVPPSSASATPALSPSPAIRQTPTCTPQTLSDPRAPTRPEVNIPPTFLSRRSAPRRQAGPVRREPS